MKKIWGSLTAKHYIFVGLAFQSSGWLSFVKMQFCRWLSFSKMQFYGYPSFKWDLVGCLGLNTKKNEKRTLPILIRGSPGKKKEELCGWWG